MRSKVGGSCGSSPAIGLTIGCIFSRAACKVCGACKARVHTLSVPFQVAFAFHVPGHRVARAKHVMGCLADSSAPKVQAAYLRTLCGGWCTKHRFQCRGLCTFGCGQGHDKLAHYAHCETEKNLFATEFTHAGIRMHGSLDSFCAWVLRRRRISYAELFVSTHSIVYIIVLDMGTSAAENSMEPLDVTFLEGRV